MASKSETAIKFARVIAAKDKRISELEAKLAAKWISVEKELPPIGEGVLFEVPSCYGVEKGTFDGSKWVSDRTSPCNDDISWPNRYGQVTHWQPLPPEPPVQP